jgi:hypothetical protein
VDCFGARRHSSCRRRGKLIRRDRYRSMVRVSSSAVQAGFDPPDAI